MAVITGTPGNDNAFEGSSLFGTDGDDTLRGLTGDDWLNSSGGSDEMDGGDDFDVVFYEFIGVATAINNTATQREGLAPFTAVKTGIGVDRLISIEAIHGSHLGDVIVTIGGYVFDRAGDDRVIGAGGASFLAGSGADVFIGENGDATLDFNAVDFDGGGAAFRGVDLTMTGAGVGTAIDPWGFTDSFSGVAGVFGSPFADTLRGGDDDDELRGGDGDDELRGGDGDDELRGDDGDDELRGGDGDDVIDGGLGDNELRGDDGADTIISRGDGDFVMGGAGDDTITVFGPDATVAPGTGDDTILNQSGEIYSLTIRYEDLATPVSVDLAAGETQGAGFRDTFTNVHRASGGDGADILRGGWNDEYEGFDDSPGGDQIDGRTGFDELIFNIGQVGEAAIYIDFAAGYVIDTFGQTDWFWNIESVRATLGADAAVGSGQDFERYRMLAGDDTVTGGAGVDRVDHARDARYGGEAGVTVNLAEGFAIDGWGDRDTLSGIEEAVGTAQADALTGDGGANLLRGDGGDDMLVGGAGADRLEGGDGVDWVGYNASTAGVQVDLAFSNGVGGEAQGDDFSDVENVTATNFDDGLWGSDAANTLLGWRGDDWLFGRGGNDRLEGWDGADRLSGGAGADTALGGAGSDRINGDAGDDVLFGGAGRDALGGDDGNDALDGGLGGDWLWGGAGSDAFVIRAASLQAGDVDRIMDMQENQASGADWLRFDGVRYDQLIWYEEGTSAVVQIALDGGGSAYVEIQNFTLAQLGDQYYFV